MYPVGVLSLYAYFLWDNKDEIMATKAAEVEAREVKEEEKLRQELLRREVNEMRDTEETVKLRQLLAKVTDRRRSRSISGSAIPRPPPAVARIVTAAELTFLFKAYEGKVTDRFLYDVM